MKTNVTEKYLRSTYSKVITLGTCTPNYLMAYTSPDYYTYGVYGWNFDAIDIDGVLVMWGDRRTFGKHADYDLIREYEEKAKQLHDKQYKELTCEEVRKGLDILRYEFVHKVLGGK